MRDNMTKNLFETVSKVNKGVYELSREVLEESQKCIEEDETKDISDSKELKFCPRCGKTYSDFPAISRYDNKTEICPDCGVEEAMINYTGGKLTNPNVYDKKDIKESDSSGNMSLEDRIAELRLALEDGSISEDEKNKVREEISDLEKELEECDNKLKESEDESDDEELDNEEDSDDDEKQEDEESDESLLDSDNIEDIIKFLIDDENKAIDGYNKAKSRVFEILSKEEANKYSDLFDHIIGEEGEHIDELTKALSGDFSALNSHDEEHLDEDSYNQDDSFIDDITNILDEVTEDIDNAVSNIKDRIEYLSDGVLEDILMREVYRFEKSGNKDLDLLLSSLTNAYDEYKESNK